MLNPLVLATNLADLMECPPRDRATGKNDMDNGPRIIVLITHSKWLVFTLAHTLLRW